MKKLLNVCSKPVQPIAEMVARYYHDAFQPLGIVGRWLIYLLFAGIIICTVGVHFILVTYVHPRSILVWLLPLTLSVDILVAVKLWSLSRALKLLEEDKLA